MSRSTTPSSARKPSKAYLRFESVIKRSLDLLTLQASTEKFWGIAQPDQAVDLSDMSRASAVLAVAAMDAYFTDVFVERLVPYLKRKGASRQLVDLLNKAGLDTECALQLIVMKNPFRRVTRMVDLHLSVMTTQKTDAIDRLFLAYGFKDFSTNVARSAKRGKRLLSAIWSLVKRRHQIVHEGDLTLQGRARKVNAKAFEARIHDIVFFVSRADEMLSTQLWKT